jgi:hypothetical protein
MLIGFGTVEAISYLHTATLHCYCFFFLAVSIHIHVMSVRCHWVSRGCEGVFTSTFPWRRCMSALWCVLVCTAGTGRVCCAPLTPPALTLGPQGQVKVALLYIVLLSLCLLHIKYGNTFRFIPLLLHEPIYVVVRLCLYVLFALFFVCCCIVVLFTSSPFNPLRPLMYICVLYII